MPASALAPTQPPVTSQEAAQDSCTLLSHYLQATTDITSPCTSQAAIHSQTASQPPLTSQAPAQDRSCSGPTTYSCTSDITNTCTGQGLAPALTATELALTSQAAAQATCLLPHYHLLAIMGPHKHPHNPGARFRPIPSSAAWDITSSCTCRSPAPHLGATQPTTGLPGT